MNVRKAGRAELRRRSEESLSPRAIAASRRDEQLRRALNLAATQPTSHVVLIEPEEDERLSAIRTSLARLLKHESRDLVWGTRNGAIVIGKEKLPPTRRSRTGRT